MGIHNAGPVTQTIVSFLYSLPSWQHAPTREHYKLVNHYKLDNPWCPLWSWSGTDGFSRSYLDRIIIRQRDKDTVSCLQIYIVSFTDHKFMTYRVILDKCQRQRIMDKWKINKAILTYKRFLNRIRELVQRAFTGAIVKNRRWSALKRAIRFESVRFSRELSLNKFKIEKKPWYLAINLECW